LSYSLTDTKYNFPAFGAADFYPSQHVRNEFKAVAIYKLGNIDLSATWIFASGRPYTAPSGAYNVTFLDGTKDNYINVTDKNGLRLPDYHRLDVAATFNWKSEEGAHRSIGISLFNLYDRTNTWYKEFQIKNNKIIETSINYLGFTPNLNVSWRLR
jgi:ferric enterobactin receptor